ncbi:AMP nucleosidase [Corynebacterium ulcerans BR-AD22]|uniref:AMP nucleosidase n=2 Tax=Corynebacterium ulcerans TaxID=65058 RepID=A0ABN4GTV3_CORUL|nr:AMP nucleosidase [Corynebacterium ulcerans BR-AD22]AKN75942.1 AMP nucleosidase [Corynebacterium ulcerans FRC58]
MTMKKGVGADVVQQLEDIYAASVSLAKEILETGEYERYCDVVYPKLIVKIVSWHPVDRTEPFGYVDAAGCYSAVLSKPELIHDYLCEQLERLCANYECVITVEPSTVRIPPEYIDGIEGVTEARRAGDVAAEIPRPTLDDVDDAIIDGEWDAFHGEEKPLFHFTPQRFDIACARIQHYTGISPASVQKYILFTNYSMHAREFVNFGLCELSREGSRYSALLLPDGHKITRDQAENIDRESLSLESRFQMPRYDLVAEDGMGITMINIGVGPSNAKTITDCLAVLRPEAWVMIGHCAGLDGRMRLGDLILGNAYQRDDHLLDDHIPLDLPIPAVPEVQRALETSVRDVYGEDLSMMRTGTVLSTDDRNWEWHTPQKLWKLLRGSTAAACDMESATLAANGYRYRIPYGTLLSVSDLPLHAVPKLPAAAQTFYANSKQAHVMCAVHAVELLALTPEKLRTRKLRRTIGEVPFR